MYFDEISYPLTWIPIIPHPQVRRNWTKRVEQF